MRRIANTMSILLPLASLAMAADGPTSMLGVSMGKNAGAMSVPMQIVIMMTLLTLLPALLMAVSPVAADIYHQGWEPLQKDQLTTAQAFDAGSKPLKAFLTRFVREKDVKLFLDISHAPAPHNASDLELRVLIPAYILSELKTGFQIGAVLFLPFLIIDLVVASVTLSIGMIQL